MGQRSTRVFISYRHNETAAYAGRLYDRLADRFGEEQIFMDVDSIGLGLDFAQAITNAVASCDVLVALIGDQWLQTADNEGRRRIDNANDFVRIEISTALQRDVRVIPVLVEEARLPSPDELPSDLRTFPRRQALRLTHETFRSEAARLINDIEQKSHGSSLGAPSAHTSAQTSEPLQSLPSATTAQWKAELLEKKPKIRVLNLYLTHRTYRIEIRTTELFKSGISLDGIKVSDRHDKWTGGPAEKFQIVDGDTRCWLEIEYNSNRWLKITRLIVSVNDKILYNES